MQPQPSHITGQLVLLGTGTSTGVPVIGCDCATCTSTDPRNQRTRCAIAVGLPEGNLLVDTPPDLRSQLLRERIGVIHAVLFTHEHVDHVYGLDDLRVFPYYLQRRLSVYCEEIVETRIRKAFDYAFAVESNEYRRAAVPQLEIRRLTTEPLQLLGAWVRPLRLLHGADEVLGFRFGDIAYCTDTNKIPDATWPLLRDLDVLILDCLRVRPHKTHFGLEEAIDTARHVGARRTFFTHISHDLEHAATNAQLPPNIELAYDGLRVPLTGRMV